MASSYSGMERASGTAVRGGKGVNVSGGVDSEFQVGNGGWGEVERMGLVNSICAYHHIHDLWSMEIWWGQANGLRFVGAR